MCLYDIHVQGQLSGNHGCEGPKMDPIPKCIFFKFPKFEDLLLKFHSQIMER